MDSAGLGRPEPLSAEHRALAARWEQLKALALRTLLLAQTEEIERLVAAWPPWMGTPLVAYGEDGYLQGLAGQLPGEPPVVLLPARRIRFAVELGEVPGAAA